MTPSDDVEAVKTSVQNIRTSGLEPLRHITITLGTNVLQLVAPQELSIDMSVPYKVTFATRDFTYYVSVRIIPPPSGLARSETSKPDASWVLEQYSDARITDELSVPTGEGDCKVFGFTWAIPGVRDRVGRIGLIQSATGMIEFAMLADPRLAKAASDDFHAVLLSLQTNRHGPIKHIPMPDHS